MKKGFTLAEVLITLTIIGVIAAVTISALYANVQKNQIAVQFSKAINSLENANRMLMQQNDVSSLGALGDVTVYADALMRLMAGTESIQNSTDIKKNFHIITSNATYLPADRFDLKSIFFGAPAYAANSTTSSATDANVKTLISAKGVAKAFATKDGILYAVINKQYVLTQTPNEPFNGNYYMILVDINANTKPNEPGQDQFAVLVDFAGMVIPYGGSLYKQYSGAGSVLWDNANTACKDTTIKDKYACTGAIVDNNYKVKYNY